MYNAKDYIDRAIFSVINQTYTNWVLYIIDDCSTDDSYDYVKNKYNKQDNIILVKNERNKGAAITRNVGLKMCQENVVCFIDSDDEWLENKLSLQISSIKAGYRIVIGNYLYKSKNEYYIKHSSNILTQYQFLKKQYRVCFSSVCINFAHEEKEYFKKIGHEDFEFLNRCFDRFGTSYVVSEIVAKYHCQENSLSSNKIKAARWHFNILKNEFGYSLPQTIYYFFHYFYNALKFSKKYR
nr:glycosyltransferase family 2 protein [Erwinia sp. S43]